MAITGTKAFTSGEILTANDVNQYLMRGVKVFSSTAVRDAAYGGAGEPTLEEGETCYITATDELQTYNGSNWVKIGPTTEPGLVLVKTQTIGTTVSSVTVSNAFSATYDKYKITIAGGVASQACTLRFSLGSTTTGYYFGVRGIAYASGDISGAGSNGNAWSAGRGETNGLFMNLDLFRPFAADETTWTGFYCSTGTSGFFVAGGGFLDNTTSYTAFTVTPDPASTMTGGVISVYGYRD